MDIAAVGSVLFTRDDSAGAVFLAWEGLRFVFNAVLTFLTLALAIAFGVVTDPRLWEVAIPGAVVANICICAGPCAEGYLALIGADRRLARGLVFSAGLSLTSLAVLFVVVAQIAFPGLGWD